MQPIGALLWGVATGIGIVLPFGPLKLLCLNRTFKLGPKAGAVTAAGVVSGDAIYVAVAFLGLSALTAVLLAATPYLKLVAAIILFSLAMTIFRAPMPCETSEAAPETMNYPKMYLGTVALTLANPITIVMFAAVLLGTGGAEVLSQGGSGGFAAAGLVLGSLSVWTVFTLAAAWAGQSLSRDKLKWLNVAGGVVLCWFAVDAARSGVGALFSS